MESLSIFHFLLAGLAAYLLYQIYLGAKGSSDKVCKACGFVGAPDTAVRGSLWIEIVLWLCFIIPGLVYSLWRSNSRHDACRKCGSIEVIPADSPIGRKIVAESASAHGQLRK